MTLCLVCVVQVSQGGTAAADALLLSGPTLSIGSTDLYYSSISQQDTLDGGGGLSSAADTAAAYGLIEVDPDDTDVDINSHLDTRPVCRFFLSETGCRNGWRCLFKHSRPACRFFLSRDGCRFGASCRFDHGEPVYNHTKLLSKAATAADASPSHQPGSSDQGLTFDWDTVPGSGPYQSVLLSSDVGEGHNVLLLGEGDFSFTAALVRRRAETAGGTAGQGLVSTSYEQQQQLHQTYPGGALKNRVKALTAAGETLN